MKFDNLFLLGEKQTNPSVLLAFLMAHFLFLGLASKLIGEEPGQSKAGKNSTKFSGWQGIRVIDQQGRPEIVRSADVDGDGAQELVVVNTRYSRLDIYEHAATPEAVPPNEYGEPNPNAIPMSPDIKRTAISLEQLPLDVLAVPAADGSPTRNLAVLVSDPNRVFLYVRDSAGEWKKDATYELADDALVEDIGSMLLDTSGKTAALLVAFEDGIQSVSLATDAKPRWISTREDRDLTDWWLADLDGDGQRDIMEQRRASEETLCWRPGRGSGMYGAARVLFDRNVMDARVLQGFPEAPVLVMDATARGMIRRYQLSQGKSRTLGKMRPLPLPGGRDAVWCAMTLNEEPALVCADPERPRMLAFRKVEDGWSEAQAYPAVSDILSIASPHATPGQLLLWVKDAADLYRSDWQGSRLGYPKPWNASEEQDEDRQIVALASVGTTTWWAQQVGSDLLLFTWSEDQQQPAQTRFEKIGSSVEKVLWIGGQRLLVKDRRARGMRLVEVVDGKTKSYQPSHLQRAEFDEYQMVVVDKTLRMTRFADGVMQWLDESLSPVDQVMLSDGRELAGYCADSNDNGWALEKNAPYLHRMASDDSGVVQAVERIRTIEAQSIQNNPILGKLLIGRGIITACEDGSPDELEQVEALEERRDKAYGYGQLKYQRFLIADVDLDGAEDALLCDDTKHRIKVLRLQNDALNTLMEWPVYEDLSYPYGGDYGDEYEAEPRAVCSMDFDGDTYPDLAFLCHDRLLIYLGREQP